MLKAAETGKASSFLCLKQYCLGRTCSHCSFTTADSFAVCSGRYPPIPQHYSDGMKALVDVLIKREPSERPSLEVHRPSALYGKMSADD